MLQASAAIRAAVLTALLLAAASCDLLGGEETSAARSGNVQLYPLQIAIEQNLGGEGSHSDTISVAVGAVVDSSALGGSAEQPQGNGGVSAEALRRERVVRHELNSSLVRNILMDVVQPDQAAIDLARGGITSANSAALSESLIAEVKELVHAEILVCAIVDLEGKELSIAAQALADGRLVYHETITDWQPLTAEDDAAVEE
jgi:hypothetical protein